MNFCKSICTACFLLLAAPVFSQPRGFHEIIGLEGSWKFRIGDDLRWAEATTDDSGWETIYVPSEWESEGYNGYDGYAWYRKSFDGRELEKATNVYINLGFIDDVDQVYINGNLVGYSGSFPPRFSTAYNSKRWYRIPAEYLKYDGKNTIAVRIFDTVHSGGIISGDVGIFASFSSQDQVLMLEGIWKFAEGYHPDWKNPGYNDDNWGVIMVPGFLHTKGKKDWKNIFWYRKTFQMDARLKGKDLVLLAGKIDDFDKVYFNGQLIGTTNDGRRLGDSYSWTEYRVYVIPKEMINWEEPNVIAVEVTDIGVNAGMYEGPVGIFPADVVGRYLR